MNGLRVTVCPNLQGLWLCVCLNVVNDLRQSVSVVLFSKEAANTSKDIQEQGHARTDCTHIVDFIWYMTSETVIRSVPSGTKSSQMQML
jgi:hypothetical protein